LKAEQIVCPGCGFNLETSEKAVKRYSKLVKYWEAGLPMRWRIGIFLGTQALVMPGMLLGIYFGAHASAVLTPWVLHGALLAFLLGTFDRLDLLRNKRGQVLLTKSWRVCFVPAKKTPVPLRDYEGVMTGIVAETAVLDWSLFLLLLGAGIVPGVLWWYYIMHKDTLYVALSKNHGFPEYMLYRGTDEAKVMDIAETLHEVAGMPYNQ
jgi:hypothetical protein